ncbi:SDR family NAD(P)-dependent oxidoreductase [Paenibacillaceae sp. P-4]|uniref:SDR family NAD(P)-dependent oxidoreductase n=1 Tax=Paenibacillaceae bacterium P-4 TaxID=3160969 RepID=UPI0032E82CAB
MDNVEKVKQIISMIESHQMTPEEGYRHIQQIRQGIDTFFDKGSEWYKVYLTKPGAIEDIVLDAVQPSDPSNSEVQVLVKAFSINFGDILCIKGLYPTQPDYPFTPGFEFSGIVMNTGSSVTRVKIGDEVIGLTGARMGAHSCVVNTDEHFLVKKPKHITFEQGCSFPVVALTMQSVFDKANLRPGEKILIQTAAGGTGLVAVQMAQKIGAEIFATAGSKEKLEYLKQLGVPHLIHYKEEDFADKIMQWTNNYGVDVVINTLSGEAVQKGLNLLASGGRYIEIAVAGLKASGAISLSHLIDNQSFHSINIRKLLTGSPDKLSLYLKRMANMLETGEVQPSVGRVFTFTEIKEAYKYLESGSNIGKVVVSTEASLPTAFSTSWMKPKQTDLSEEVRPLRNCSDIAIIGAAGKFPGAKNLDEFWDNLKNGRCTIGEIPKERWDTEQYYDPDPKKLDKTYCKWGGILEDIDQFDAVFFNMSGKEAEVTDPQQRIFLEVCWNALEDAGYAIESMDKKKCGVFVGASGGDYLAKMQEDGVPMEPQSFWGNSASVLAARISYFLNLKGPSLTIDTACSSSLVAIHLGCRSILAGESEMAIAGGVFISLTPAFIILSSNAGMLSPVGRCKAFDDGADGFVPGEGAGAVVLKSLDAALRDGDHIYGVIKGSAINQDGKTNGMTAPSTLSQTEVELTVYREANIHPRTIQLVEAHGTGTKLGDPIEVEALTNAFRQYTHDTQFCKIGSVKTNIGHAAAAAGVASVIKVLLAFKYKQIPPNIHFRLQNRHIQFEETPFQVAAELEQWTASDVPRRAAVSSFGFSGTNAHMVIEEAPRADACLSPELPYYLIPISAKNKQAYDSALRNMLKWLEIEAVDYSISDISYSLQISRMHFSYRSMLIVQTKQELIEKLKRYLNGEQIENFFLCNLKDHRSIETKVFPEESQEVLFEAAMLSTDYGNKVKTAIEMYCQGNEVPWHELWPLGTVRKIPLPTYSFNRQRYWYRQGRRQSVNKASRRSGVKLHPLVEQNVSTIEETKFSLTLTGDEFYIQDHVVGAAPLMPGAAYIEMAVASAELAFQAQISSLRNVIWASPLSVENEPCRLEIRYRKEKAGASYEIYSIQPGSGEIIHSRGNIGTVAVDKPASKLDIQEIVNRSSSSYSKEHCYNMFRTAGFQYGSTFQSIQHLWVNRQEAIARLELAAECDENDSIFNLHPAMLDGALQTVMGNLLFGDASVDERYLPFSVGSIEIYDRIPRSGYAYVRDRTDSQRIADMKCFDVYVTDDEGRLIVHLKEFLSRAVPAVSAAPLLQGKQNHTASPEWLRFRPIWKPEERVSIPENRLEGSVLVWSHSEEFFRKIRGQCVNPERAVWVKPGNCFLTTDSGHYTVALESEEDMRLLIRATEQNEVEPSHIIVHSQSAEKTPDLLQVDEQLEQVLYPVFMLIRELVAAKSKRQLNVLYAFQNGGGQPFPYAAAIASFLKSVSLEHPNVQTKSVEWGMPVEDDSDLMVETLITELVRILPSEREIRYLNGKREVAAIEEIHSPSEYSAYSLKDKGIYAITGGMGGIGFGIAEHLARTHQAGLALLGRSPLNPCIEEKIAKLRAYGSEVIYLEADLAIYSDTERAVERICSHFGRLHGIFHCAGLTRDSLLVEKTLTDLKDVLAAKVWGTVHLDCASQRYVPNLDFLMLFSSVSGMHGNVGQTDYAYANRFMDRYAEYRSVREGGGRTISISWPLWKEGGMKIDPHTERLFMTAVGMSGISTETGLAIIKEGLLLNHAHIAVIAGNGEKIRKWAGVTVTENNPGRIKQGHIREKDISISSESDETRWHEQYRSEVVQIISSVLRIDREAIDYYGELAEYGFDSLTLTEFAAQLGGAYQLELTPASFFGHSTIEGIAEAIFEEFKDNIFIAHREKENSVHPEKRASLANEKEPPADSSEDSDHMIHSSKVDNELGAAQDGTAASDEVRSYEPVAIIGMSGKMPSSDDLDEFWRNLEQGRNMISIIPQNRWDWTEYYGDPNSEINKTDIKWGGFMKEVDKFDPLFFGISPREAELMDPQQRIFLESVWSAIEDAGYRASDLSGSDTGLFVGVASSDYNEILQHTTAEVEAQTSTGMSHAVLPNRISYLLNLHGPSEPVNTACSSSLVAIHRAVEAIQNGHCEMAIAGGVNVILTPTLHISFSKAGMLARDGNCKTFDSSADGYVRGEGTGAVILKSLKKAVEDGDHIYAVIKGSAVNHGGKTNSLTAPNPYAQANLIVKAFGKAHIDPATVTLIEAHGTGTHLGDPVEINGLKAAFAQLYQKWGKSTPIVPHCGVGSVKTSIGHLEAAAGIAGIFKIALSMKHGTIPGNLHFERMNPYIQLDGSPFYIVNKTIPWARLTDSEGRELPRRAGISSFGFGGANCHIVLEEFCDVRPVDSCIDPQIIVISAKKKSALKEYCNKLYQFLTIGQTGEPTGYEQSLSPTAHESILSELIRYSSEMLNVGREEIDPWEHLLHLGFTQVELVSLAEQISKAYQIDFPASLLAIYSTLEAVTGYLLESIPYCGGSGKSAGINLQRLACTLQSGREEFGWRLAIIAADEADLSNKLMELLKAEDMKLPSVFYGKVERKIRGKTDKEFDEASDEIIEAIRQRDLTALAQLWVNGSQIPWEQVHRGRKQLRMPLPSYPFARERYWIPEAQAPSVEIEDEQLLQLLRQLENGTSSIERVRQAMGVME